MSLPSRYAPGGIGRKDDKKILVLGSKRRNSADYTIRLIEDRVDKAARNPHKYDESGDIEMVLMDNSEEVEVITNYVTNSRVAGDFSYDDSMDLDKLYFQTQTIRINENLSYLVVDTNFILSHLKILDELKNLGEEYGIRLVIPMAVMHELDGLKGSKRADERNGNPSQLSGESVGYLARWANDWVYSSLATRSTTVIGQKMDERLDKLAIKDDAILDCCLYFQKHKPHTLQVLMSNDKNLCMKALLNNVLTVSFRDEMSAKLIAEMVKNENIHRFGKIEKQAVITKEVEVPIKQHVPVCANPYKTVYSEIQKVLLAVVHCCMKSSYGNDLELVRGYDKSSICTLEDASYVMIRFWLPVFSEYLLSNKPFITKGRQQKIPQMVDLPDNKESLVTFVHYWSDILKVLYQHEMSDSQNAALDQLIQRWDDLAENSES
ncbi:CIC11C00000002439 [Sungouiella intermedia]|uniref:Transcriptional protein SWT1 n=1 Tax=Sungouiella intermedia TaxID=45354 RepID=A0A1L0DQ04_9ASCO|nr:CIC11C00000002439 [[Candida] intermedia]